MKRLFAWLSSLFIMLGGCTSASVKAELPAHGVTLPAVRGEALVKDFRRQYEEKTRLLESGKYKPTIQEAVQLMYLGKALGFIDYAREQFNLAFLFNEEELPLLDDLLESLRNAHQQGQVSDDQLKIFIESIGSYLGYMMVIHQNGQWCIPDAPLSNDGIVWLNNGKTAVLVIQKVEKRVMNGEEDSIVLFYYHFADETKKKDMPPIFKNHE